MGKPSGDKPTDGSPDAGEVSVGTENLYTTPEFLPPPGRPWQRNLWQRIRRSPFMLLSLYYVVLIGLTALLIMYVPGVRRAFLSPVLPADAAGIFGGTPPQSVEPEMNTLGEALERAGTTFIVTLGALLIVMPVARVYMFTKRLRYDPSLVRSVIILPIVVAGITVVVKNSIALAFSLAGIVAAVRFRNTLKDPRDAVYIFLAISIGLAAGVQALDVALVTSLSFNFLVLVLGKFSIGSIYSGQYGRTGVLSTGPPEMLVAQSPERRKQIRRSLLAEAEDLDTDAILLVHAKDPELARHTVQEALSEKAKDWRLVKIVTRSAELSTLEYLIRLKKKSGPGELVGALDERWSSQVSAAEYIPFRTREIERDDD